MMVTIVLGIGSLPLTKWDDIGGVPLADEWIYALFFFPFAIEVPCFFGFMYSGFDPPIAPKLHFGWYNSWNGRVLPMILVGSVIIILGSIGALLLGVESFRFSFFDVLGLLLYFPIVVPVGEMVARWNVKDPAPIRNSLRRLSQGVLLLHDDEGTLTVGQISYTLPVSLSVCLYLSLRLHLYITSCSPCPSISACL